MVPQAAYPDFSLPKPFFAEMVEVMSRVHNLAELAYEECFDELDDPRQSLERSSVYILFEGEKIRAKDIVTDVAFRGLLLKNPRKSKEATKVG